MKDDMILKWEEKNIIVSALKVYLEKLKYAKTYDSFLKETDMIYVEKIKEIEELKHKLLLKDNIKIEN